MKYLTQNINGYLLAQQEYAFAKFVLLIHGLIRTVLLIVVISLCKYAILIAVVDLVLTTIVFFISLMYCKRGYSPVFSLRFFDRTIFRSSVPMCVALLLHALTNQANNNVDKFIIIITTNMEGVVLYSVVQYVFTIFSSVATVPHRDVFIGAFQDNGRTA